MTQNDDVLQWSTERGSDPIAPPPQFTEIQRSSEPMRRVRIWDGSEPWLVTTYDDYRIIASDDKRFSADTSRPGFPLKNAGYKSKNRSFLQMDDPEHLPYRRMWAKHLSAPRMEQLRPGIQAIVDEAIDKLLAKPGEADFIADFALSVPALILGEVFGVPAEDRERFLDLASTMSSADSTPEQAAEAIRKLSVWAEGLVDDKEKNPGDDLISRFWDDGVRAGVMTRQELVNTVVGLVGAAHDTSVALIAFGTLALLRNPDQLDLLRENSDDPKFVAGAVEELLRYVSPTQTGRRRLALVDAEIGGNLIKAGDGVIALDNVSSRDPGKFEDPDRLDLTRADARRHNAFGFGTHQCAGQSLARIELQVVFATLYKRIPTLRLAAPESELPRREDTVVYVVDEMPVAW